MNYKNILLSGMSKKTSDPLILKSGRLTMQYSNGFIRQIRSGDHEVLRMVYFALRDHNWETIPGSITNEQIRISNDSFWVTYDINYHKGDVLYRIQSEIKGDPAGAISFKITGEALSDFRKNRIGFCVLHPPDCAENMCKIGHPDGKKSNIPFPKYISAHQPFRDIKTMTWHINDMQEAKIHFSGDIFEMEDQRNWTDASFKTYCTPLEVPFPIKVLKGDRVEQEMHLEVSGPLSGRDKKDDEAPRIDWNEPAAKLPMIGLGNSDSLLTENEATKISSLNLSHLRIELDLTSDNWMKILEIGMENVSRTLLNVELALLFGSDPESDMEEFRGGYIWGKATLIAISVFRKDNHITDNGLFFILKELGEMFPGARIGGGSNAYFTEMNRNRPDSKELEYLTYPITPQVHAYDDLTLVENLAGQFETVLSAQQFSETLPIHVSPVSLKPRFNPDATGTPPDHDEATFPPDVDTRQASLFNMAWTLASIKNLVFADTGLITYFVTVGWKGIIHGDKILQFPEKSYSQPGDVFPVYAVFYLIGNFKASGHVPAYSGNPLEYELLVFSNGDKYRILISNLTIKDISLKLIIPRSTGRILKIDDLNAKRFMTDPQKFIETNWIDEKFTESNYILCLRPYSLLAIDI